MNRLEINLQHENTVQGTRAVDPIKLGMSFFAFFCIFFAFCEILYMLCKPDL